MPDDLKQKIRAAQERQRALLRTDDNASSSQTGGSAAGAALRVATDLVAAIAVGGFLGYWLDEWLGTRPLFMVVLFFLGFAAGFLNIYRAQMGKDFEIGFKDTPVQKPQDNDDNSSADAAKKE